MTESKRVVEVIEESDVTTACDANASELLSSFEARRRQPLQGTWGTVPPPDGASVSGYFSALLGGPAPTASTSGAKVAQCRSWSRRIARDATPTSTPESPTPKNAAGSDTSTPTSDPWILGSYTARALMIAA